MTRFILTLIAINIIPRSIANKTINHQPIVVEYNQRPQKYLFGQPMSFNIHKPSHPNWGGLIRSWHNSNAWDIFVPSETAVHSIIEGRVLSSRFVENGRTVWGHNVIIESDDDKVFYTHLGNVLVCPGDTIKKGQLIGYVGQWPECYRLLDGSPMPSHIHIALYRYKLNKYLDYNLTIC